MGSWAGTHAAHVFTAQVFGDYLLITSININALLWNSGVHVHPARHFEHLSIFKRQSAAHRFPMFWSSYLIKYQSRFLNSCDSHDVYDSLISYILSPTLPTVVLKYLPLTHSSHLPRIVPELQCQFIQQSGKQSQMSRRMMNEAGGTRDRRARGRMAERRAQVEGKR